MLAQAKRPQLKAAPPPTPQKPPLKPATQPATPMPRLFAGGRALERPTQKKQKKACPSCATGESTCPECQAKRTPTLERPPSTTQTRRGSPSEDPAERQADDLGKRIGDDLSGTESVGHGPLPKSVQQVAEFHLGVSLEGTHIDAGSSGQRKAKDESALAVTEGKHVAFGEGQLNTSSAEGRVLLGHELVHVGQQRLHVQSAPQRQPDAQEEPEWKPVGAESGEIDPMTLAATAQAKRAVQKDMDVFSLDNPVVMRVAGAQVASYQAALSEAERRGARLAKALAKADGDLVSLKAKTSPSSADKLTLKRLQKGAAATKVLLGHTIPNKYWNDASFTREVKLVTDQAHRLPAGHPARNDALSYAAALRGCRLKKKNLIHRLNTVGALDPSSGRLRRCAQQATVPAPTLEGNAVAQNPLDDKFIDEVARGEGFSAVPYFGPDKLCTIGHGHVVMAANCRPDLTAPELRFGTLHYPPCVCDPPWDRPIDEARARDLLREDVSHAATHVEQALPLALLAPSESPDDQARGVRALTDLTLHRGSLPYSLTAKGYELLCGSAEEQRRFWHAYTETGLSTVGKTGVTPGFAARRKKWLRPGSY